MSKPLVIAAFVVACVATCFATDMPTLQSDTAPMQIVKKPIAVGPSVAVQPGTNVIRTTSNTLAVLEITGDPATGEVTVKQVPILGDDGQFKQNELFTQDGVGSCGDCTGPDPNACTRSISADLVFWAGGPRYICNADLSIGSASAQVTGITNKTLAGSALPADVYASADTTLSFDVSLSSCSQRFSIYVNIEGQVRQTPCDSSLAFRLTWDQNSTADLDIRVLGPTGCSLIYFNNPTSCGGELDVTCNDIPDTGDCTDTDRLCEFPVERIIWVTAPPEGTYRWGVWTYEECDETYPIDWTVEILENGSVVDTITGQADFKQDWSDYATHAFP